MEKQTGKKKGGMGMAKVSFNISQNLKDVDFPCSREQLIEEARETGAGKDVLNIIGQMPDQLYHSMADVEKAFSMASHKAA